MVCTRHSRAASWTRQTGAIDVDFSSPSTFALVSHKCNPTGGLYAQLTMSTYNQVAFSPDDGVTFLTPQLSSVASVVTGPNCTAYAVHQPDQASSDAYLAKLAPDGSILWATFLGGSDVDTAVALTLDAQGNVYVTGNTVSPDFPSTVPRIGVEGENSVFVTKYWSDGKIIYSALIGGEAANYAYAIAVDLGQNAHLLGQTGSLGFPVTPGALIPTLEPEATRVSYAAVPQCDGHLRNLPGRIVYSSWGDSGGRRRSSYRGWERPAPGLPPPQEGTSPDFVSEIGFDRFACCSGRLTSRDRVSAQSAPSALVADASGNLVVLGTVTGTTFPNYARRVHPILLLHYCEAFSGIYVTKLGASRLESDIQRLPALQRSVGSGRCGWHGRCHPHSGALSWGFPCTIRCWPRRPGPYNYP